MHLAHECESKGNYRAAENHFIQAGEWKLAVKMYRSLDMWEEAYKVFYPKSISYFRVNVYAYLLYYILFLIHDNTNININIILRNVNQQSLLDRKHPSVLL